MSHPTTRSIPFRAAGLLALLALLLASCGAAGTPERTNERWVQGMIENDRQTLAAMVEPALIPGFSASFHTIQQNLRGENSTLGAFQEAHALKVETHGKGSNGYSLWVFEKARKCYELDMAQGADGWIITDFTGTDMADCE
jgi:hypothetical protein